jgi:hypothetical protein
VSALPGPNLRPHGRGRPWKSGWITSLYAVRAGSAEPTAQLPRQRRGRVYARPGRAKFKLRAGRRPYLVPAFPYSSGAVGLNVPKVPGAPGRKEMGERADAAAAPDALEWAQLSHFRRPGGHRMSRVQKIRRRLRRRRRSRRGAAGTAVRRARVAEGGPTWLSR